MTTESKTKKDAFVEKLRQRFLDRTDDGKPNSKLDRAGRAVLSRHAGKTLSESRQAFPAFYKLAPPKGPAEERAFLVATLFCLARGHKGPRLPAALRGLAGEFSEEALERRFVHLLDCSEPNELSFRLRQVVKLLASKGKGLDWAALLGDLNQWNHPDKYIQKQWARDFFGGAPKDDQKGPQNAI